MESLAIVLFCITLIGVIANIGFIIYSSIKKEFRYIPKKLSILLIVSIVAFVGSTTFYGIVQSPKSKAKYEASQKSKEEEKSQKELAEAEKKADEEVYKSDDRFTITSEANTNDAVDEIYYKAKENSVKAKEDDIKEAIKFIADNYNNYWMDNETMHKTMYYGSLLECAERDKAKDNQKGLDYTIYSLGEDAVEVVKFVYRKAEKVDDTSTQSNLEQIKKLLDKIPSNLK